MLGMERTFTGREIGDDVQNGGAVCTCCTEIVPAPDHWTVTGFAVAEPTIDPPTTVHKKVYPGPDGVAVY